MDSIIDTLKNSIDLIIVDILKRSYPYLLEIFQTNETKLTMKWNPKDQDIYRFLVSSEIIKKYEHEIYNKWLEEDKTYNHVNNVVFTL